jgi:hypothetical protein
MRLILVRHGHVDGIYPPRLRGRCDVDLSELRLQQAYALKEIAAQFSDNRLPRPAADLPTLCLQHLRKLARQDPSTERDPGADRLLAALTHRLLRRPLGPPKTCNAMYSSATHSPRSGSEEVKCCREARWDSWPAAVRFPCNLESSEGRPPAPAELPKHACSHAFRRRRNSCVPTAH